MALIEREGFLASLQAKFEAAAAGEGHCVFIMGEAGIGKTSLVKAFCRKLQGRATIYQGFCDALFTPRPLAPLYDILLQVCPGPAGDAQKVEAPVEDRTAVFARFLHALRNQEQPDLIIFEDIHWADAAILDFIKFLARRITQLRCLFILTYRDEERPARQALRNLLGQLNPDSFTRMPLPPLSQKAVEKMSGEKGYDGGAIYSISNGNPFYVSEILASYSAGIPDNIKDSILSVYSRQDEQTRQLWELLSVLPTGFESVFLKKMNPGYILAAENVLASGILILKEGLILFKHELYRRTIEASLSPLLRVTLNRRILDLLLEDFMEDRGIERLIHHAKEANDYALVVRYAPIAAEKAASVGAHTEAARLYLSAIECYHGNDATLLIRLYEAYAYECYLTNRVREPSCVWRKRWRSIGGSKEDSI